MSIGNHTMSISSQCKLQLNGNNGKYLILDFNADTLKTYGTMAIDSAGMVFFKWCFERYTGRITELKDEITRLKRGAMPR